MAARLARAQVAHPRRFLWAALAVSLVAVLVAAGMNFDSSYEALLPEGAPQVKNVDQVRERTGGFRQLVLAIGGEDPELRLAFGRQLALQLQQVEGVRAADLEFPAEFFRDRSIWLAETAVLEEMVRAVHQAVQVTMFPFSTVDPHTAWGRVEGIIEREKGRLPFDSTVLTSRDGRYTFLLLVPTISFSDVGAGEALLGAIEGKVRDLDPATQGLEVRYAGNLQVMQEQHRIMSKDLRRASLLALLFGVTIVAVFTRRALAPVVVGASLLAGIAWTFSIVRLTIGHVNIITGFLVAVLIGLGIDFGIHLLIRYQQERRQEGSSARSAVLGAVQGTLPPALTGALTTAGTFFSFAVADFRGFSEFGIIAGLGVLMTMTSIFLVLPPLMFLLDKRLHMPGKPRPRDGLQPRISRPLAWGMVAAGIMAAVYGLSQAGDIPFRNNYKLLRGHSPATEFIEYVDKNIGVGFNPAVFLVDSLEEARQLKQLAMELKEQGLPDGRPSRMGAVLSGADLVPDDLQRREEWIGKLTAIVENPALDRFAEGEGTRAVKLNQARRMVKTVPWSFADLPEPLQRRFSTPDRSTLLAMVWPCEQNHADYHAAAWEDELEILSQRLRQRGIEHQKADETLMMAWVYRLIQADGPPLLMLAAVVVLVFLLLDFRHIGRTALVALPLAVGMLAFIGAIAAWGMELNMFNLIVVPSIIGIGIDNAVHIYHRYRAEGPGSVLLVIRRTGMAALLASLTTAAGFGSSLISHHYGLRTMGMLAIIGISATFLSATIFFPCLLSLLESRKPRAG